MLQAVETRKLPTPIFSFFLMERYTNVYSKDAEFYLNALDFI